MFLAGESGEVHATQILGRSLSSTIRFSSSALIIKREPSLCDAILPEYAQDLTVHTDMPRAAAASFTPYIFLSIAPFDAIACPSKAMQIDPTEANRIYSSETQQK